VLNFTTFGQDEGFRDNFWYKETPGTCRYKLNISDAKFSQGGGKLERLELFLGVGNAMMQRKFIDLNELDPKNITIRYDYNETLWGRSGATLIEHVNDIIFFNLGKSNMDRLQRGWNLIYGKYCRGKQKPF
jgi:hypothetical protein